MKETYNLGFPVYRHSYVDACKSACYKMLQLRSILCLCCISVLLLCLSACAPEAETEGERIALADIAVISEGQDGVTFQGLDWWQSEDDLMKAYPDQADGFTEPHAFSIGFERTVEEIDTISVFSFTEDQFYKGEFCLQLFSHEDFAQWSETLTAQAEAYLPPPEKGSLQDFDENHQVRWIMEDDSRVSLYAEYQYETEQRPMSYLIVITVLKMPGAMQVP